MIDHLKPDRQQQISVLEDGAGEAIWLAQFKQCFMTLLFVAVPFEKFVELSLILELNGGTFRDRITMLINQLH